MKLRDYYQQKIQSGHVRRDEKQLSILTYLQTILDALEEEYCARSSFLTQLFIKKKLVKGLYLWGRVGVGKTFLMDAFYECIPFENKMRMHFHKFMEMVHAQFKQLQGKKNPLTIIAKQLSKKTMVLCFDEFFVEDVADAMILGRLMKELFSEGITLVTTSNIPPDQLYLHGLQRQNFLPTITLLQAKTHVMHLDSTYDYRLAHMKEEGVYYRPLGKKAEQKLEKAFSMYQRPEVSTDPIVVLGRTIPIKKQSGRTIWFEFSNICGIPRSHKDYLYLSEHYDTVLISNIPIIHANETDLIVTFIHLVDVFYDARVKLIVSSEVSPEEIYLKGRMVATFARTRSRLTEMQSSAYFE